VETKTMMTYYLAKRDHVDGEKKGPEHRALRHTLLDWGKLFPI